jgi:seryl-tRNA synthetase
VHTLNSTLVATERTLTVLLENYFDEEKMTLEVPPVLVKYMDGQTEVKPVNR